MCANLRSAHSPIPSLLLSSKILRLRLLPHSYVWKDPEFSTMVENLFYRYHLDDSNRPYEHRIVDVADPSVATPILKEILHKVCTRRLAASLLSWLRCPPIH